MIVTVPSAKQLWPVSTGLCPFSLPPRRSNGCRLLVTGLIRRSLFALPTVFVGQPLRLPIFRQASEALALQRLGYQTVPRVSQRALAIRYCSSSQRWHSLCRPVFVMAAVSAAQATRLPLQDRQSRSSSTPFRCTCRWSASSRSHL